MVSSPAVSRRRRHGSTHGGYDPDDSVGRQISYRLPTTHFKPKWPSNTATGPLAKPRRSSAGDAPPSTPDSTNSGPASVAWTPMNLRGRKKTEELCPELEDHIHRLVEPQAQADPKFQTTLAFTRITAKAVREALQAEPELAGSVPAARPLAGLLNRLGYRLRRVLKARPEKKFPKPTRSSPTSTPPAPEAAVDPDTLRISLDTKAKVKVGEFSRGGRARGAKPVKAVDHDMSPEAMLVPFGRAGGESRADGDASTVVPLRPFERNQRLHRRRPGTMVDRAESDLSRRPATAHRTRQRSGDRQFSHAVHETDGGSSSIATGWRSSWCTCRRTIASTIPSSVAGASWSSIGAVRCCRRSRWSCCGPRR